MADFKRLHITDLARQNVVAIYQVTAGFPSSERFALSSQMQRAAISIGANIAEGAGRSTDREFARFLRIARGSAHELEFHLLAASDLGFLSEQAAEDINRTLTKLSSMLHGLIRKLSA
jgi:four helix bundle protein